MTGSRRRRGTRRRRAQGKSGGGKVGGKVGGKGSKKSKKSKIADPLLDNALSEEAGETNILDDPEIGARVTSRTVQIQHVGNPGKCIGYIASQISSLRLIDCTITGEADFWEVVETTTSDLFLLRHAVSQMCIPQNPEFPTLPFDCFAPSGSDVAIADSINDLVGCDTSFAAEIGFIDPVNNMIMYNNACSSGQDTDLALMSYTTEDNASLVLWGEKILLGMEEMVEEYQLNGMWQFVDVSPQSP